MAVPPDDTVAVLGAGSWGTALAVLLARNGRRTRLWGHNARELLRMSQQRCNDRYLPGVEFPDTLQLADRLDDALNTSANVLIAVPSHAFQDLLNKVAPSLRTNAFIAWATKGLQPGTGRFMHQIAETIITQHAYAVISGPTFAKEVAAGLPTAVTVASQSLPCAQQFAELLHNMNFRVYTGSDVIGVEVGGSVKNVLAIAAGIADGLGFGANTRAALVTRGLTEMMRLGESLGGRRETFMGLAGLGDLVLTSTDNQSRNRRLGLALGSGMQLQNALATIDQVVEGVQTARQVMQLARSLEVDMPICQQVHAVIWENRSPRDAVSALLGRAQKNEDL